MADRYLFDVFSEHSRGDKIVSVARVCGSWVLLMRVAGQPLSEARVCFGGYDAATGAAVSFEARPRGWVARAAKSWEYGGVELW